MKVIVALDTHPVYKSLFHTFKYMNLGPVYQFKDYREKMHYIFRGSSFHIQSLDIQFSNENLYVLNSPLMAYEAWVAAKNRINVLFVEEYFHKSFYKDLLVKFILSRFKNYPFISMTKRTHSFLSESSLSSFLIPPALEKKKGRKNRDVILFVGRMVDTKNPFFILELAKRLKNEDFVMVGDGPLLQKLKLYSKDYPNVTAIDYVPNQRLFTDFYSRAKVLIHPAKKDPIGFTVIEALSTSTPVLTTQYVGSSDFLPKRWVLNEYDVNKWIEKIKDMSGDDIKEANRIFDKEHLNIEDKYFKQVALEIKKSMNSYINKC
jgi:glycosyltransferase involved in cell wall biosynthesis